MVSVGGRELWPGAEGAKGIEVQYDLDWTRFIEMFVERVRAPFSLTTWERYRDAERRHSDKVSVRNTETQRL